MFQYKWTSDHLDSIPILILRPTVTYDFRFLRIHFFCNTPDTTDTDGFRWNIAKGVDCYMIGA